MAKKSGTIVLLAGGAALLLMAGKKKSKGSSSSSMPPDDGIYPGGSYPSGSTEPSSSGSTGSSGSTSKAGATVPSTGNYVGNGWTGWSDKDLFPNEAYFGLTLDMLGYNVGAGDYYMLPTPTFKVGLARVQDAIKAFQSNFNSILSSLRSWGVVPSTTNKLTVDGLIGPKTAKAFAYALEALNTTKGVNCDPTWWEISAQDDTCKEAWISLILDAS